MRQNVLFGQKDNEVRFREVIRACSLEHDLEVLPNGEETEIGEKGINLSGALTNCYLAIVWSEFCVFQGGQKVEIDYLSSMIPVDEVLNTFLLPYLG